MKRAVLSLCTITFTHRTVPQVCLSYGLLMNLITVEILIMHIVIMHNSHNALSFRASRVGIRGKWVNIAYCIMHEVSGSIMHYEDTL